MNIQTLHSVIDWIAAHPFLSLFGVLAFSMALIAVALAMATSKGLAAIQADIASRASAESVMQSANTTPVGEAASEPQWNGSEAARIRAIPGRKLTQSLDELLEIEESLLGLRELYWRKLIPLDVYARESLKVGSRLKV